MANENPESASLNGFLSHGMAWEHFWDFKLSNTSIYIKMTYSVLRILWELYLTHSTSIYL